MHIKGADGRLDRGKGEEVWDEDSTCDIREFVREEK